MRGSRPFGRQFFSFFLGSAVGLAIDLLGFFFLVNAGLDPWMANAISSVLSVTAVYFLVTRYTFAASPQVATYVLFFAWYATSIALFSTAIQVISIETSVGAEWVKLASVPISFILNFGFSRFLFRNRPAR